MSSFCIDTTKRNLDEYGGALLSFDNAKALMEDLATLMILYPNLKIKIRKGTKSECSWTAKLRLAKP